MSHDAYVIVSPEYLPHMGGVERYSWNLAGELLNRGSTVYVISSSMRGEPERSVDERGVITLRFPSIWIIPNRMPVPIPAGKWSALKKELKQYKSVKLIAQTNLYLLSLIGIKYAKRNHIKSVMIIHGSNYVCLGKGITDKLEHIYERCITKKANRNHALFAAVSEASASFAESLGCQVKAIAHNAIYYQDIESIQINERETIYNQYRLSEKTKLFIYVGRMIREKGALQLAEAFSRIAEEEKDVALVMIGDGPLLEELKNIKIKNMFFTGELPHEETIHYMMQAECFVLPSDSEGFPTTILEAADCDCFVITAPYGGQKEAAELVNGYIMKDNSADSIYFACRYYLDNSAKLLSDLQRGKQTLKETVNWQNTTDKIIKVFDNK